MRVSCFLFSLVFVLVGCSKADDPEPAPVLDDRVHFVTPEDGDAISIPSVRVQGDVRLAAGISWMTAEINGERIALPTTGGTTAPFSFVAALRSGKNRIEVRALGKDGGSASGFIEVVGTYSHVLIQRFAASPANHAPDEPVTLDWSVSGAEPLLVELEGHGTVDPVGSLVVEPRARTTWRLIASNEGGTASAEVVTHVLPRVPRDFPVSGVGVRSRLALEPAGTSTWTWSGEGVYDYGSGHGQFTAPDAVGSYEITARDSNNPSLALHRKIEVVDPVPPIGAFSSVGGQPGATHFRVVGNASGDVLFGRQQQSLLWLEDEQRWATIELGVEPLGEWLGPDESFVLLGWVDATYQLLHIAPGAPEPIVRRIGLPADLGNFMPAVHAVGDTVYVASRDPGLPTRRLYTLRLTEEEWRLTPALPGGMRAMEIASVPDASLVVLGQAVDVRSLFLLAPGAGSWQELDVEVQDAGLHGFADGEVLILGGNLRRLASDGTTTLLAASLPEGRSGGIARHGGDLVLLTDTTLHRHDGEAAFHPWLEIPEEARPALHQVGHDRVYLLGPAGAWELDDTGWIRKGTAGLPGAPISALSVGADGAVAVAHDRSAEWARGNGGVYLRLAGDSDFLQLLPPSTSAAESRAIEHIAWRGDSALAFADGTTLFISAPPGEEPSRIEFGDAFSTRPILGLAAGSDETWLVCAHAGVFAWTEGTGWSPRAPLADLRACTFDEDGAVWAVAGAAVFHLPADGLAWEQLPGVEAGFIGSLAIAGDGRVWAAGEGVYRLVGPGWEVMGSAGCGTDAERVFPVGEQSALCHGRGQLQWLDGESGAWSRVSPRLEGSTAAAIAVHADGTLYVGTRYLGLVETRVVDMP